MKNIKVLLADDHKILREGLRHIIEDELEMEVVGQATNGRSAVALAAELHPDLVIMDISMPELNGIEATRQILQQASHVKVIALSMHTNREFVSKMFGAGATAYLLKECAVDELGDAIKCVLANKIYISPDIASVVVEDFLRKSEGKDAVPPGKLTAKEREVLQLIAEGKSTKEIASIFNTSISTVETHRQHVMEKLNIYTVAGLTKYAIREGLTSLE
ncbi:MAG: response regulator [Bacteroidota bacterium]